MFKRLTSAAREDDEEIQTPLLESSPEDLSTESMVEDPEATYRQGLSSWMSLNKEEFIEYCKRFCFLTFWVALLLLNFCLGRFYVHWGLPSDGEKGLDAYDVFQSVNNLLLYGMVLGWFVGITQNDRALWIYNWKRWYFFVLFFLVNPLYSWISNAKALQHSFEDMGDWGGAMWTVVILGIVATSVAVLWHLYFAFKHHTIYGLIVYLFSRAIVILYYWIFAVEMQDTHHRDVHLHHYFTGWMAALFAEFDHPISCLLLGTMSSIFVQGISAYGFDPLFNDEECYSFKTDRNATCYISSQDAFGMHMCPGKRDEVMLKCYKGLPKHSPFYS